MKAGDFLLYTLEGDTANPPNTYSAEILSVDWATSFFTCRQADSGDQITFQFSTNTSGPWQGQDSQGADITIDSHDIYTAAATDPTPQGVALVTFADNNHYLCSVQSVSPTIDVVFYLQSSPRLSIENNAVTQSNWDTYPVGTTILSIEAYVLNNDLIPPGYFSNGLWSLARQTPAFPGRIGGVIAPFAVVVHTTDTVPEAHDGLVHNWTTAIGRGECAHFIIGRDQTQGVIQLTPITNNANHAGGAGHGSFVAGQQTWHPNLVSVGIEIDCAGQVRQLNGQWRLFEDGHPTGNPLPNADVTPDPAHPGIGYHNVTDYQYQQLGLLLNGLETVLGALPAGCVAQSIEQPPTWAIFPTGRRVGHVSLHAQDRGDPWPPTCNWIRARG
jgi:hypothetical protein